MKQNNFKRRIFLGIILLPLTFLACKKIPKGFLSEGLYVPDSPIQLDKGATLQVTNSIRLDGSTSPITFKLLDLRRVGTDKTAEEFMAPQKVYVYTQAIDPTTDTTIELINKKRELKELPPFQFTPAGQFIFNAGTAVLPTGAEYEYDVEATNPAGSKIIKNIGLIHVIETEPFVNEGGGSAWFRDFSTISGGLPNIDMTITKIADTGSYAILKITDENGKSFNPKAGEVISRGVKGEDNFRPTFESYARFHPIIYTDSTLTCNFEIAPFPLVDVGFGHLIYYRIPSKFVTINPGILPAAEAGLTHSANPRFAFFLKKVGTYLIVVKVNGVTHV